MKFVRLILGYIIGVTVFLILLPSLLVVISLNFDHLWWTKPVISLFVRLCVSVPFFMVGVFFAVWSNISLLIIGKGGPADVFNYAISPRTRKLVITGPYKYTRNPMVFGMLSVYLSISIFYFSLTCFLFLVFFIPFVVLYLKRTEERRLFKDFGREFTDYKSKVPMIIPFW